MRLGHRFIRFCVFVGKGNFGFARHPIHRQAGNEPAHQGHCRAGDGHPAGARAAREERAGSGIENCRGSSRTIAVAVSCAGGRRQGKETLKTILTETILWGVRTMFNAVSQFRRMERADAFSSYSIRNLEKAEGRISAHRRETTTNIQIKGEK